MLKKDVLDHFGGHRATALAIGITRAAVYQWPDRIPITSAIRVDRATAGKLKFNPADYLSTEKAAS